jgi:hypothetical protein
MTTNPKWPEIVSQLQAGQTAADAPLIVCRAFQNRLVALCKFLHRRFGRVVYLITVVEFQKRGLPHAHLLVKLSPKIPLNSIDNVVRAELPSKEEDLELY